MIPTQSKTTPRAPTPGVLIDLVDELQPQESPGEGSLSEALKLARKISEDRRVTLRIVTAEAGRLPLELMGTSGQARSAFEMTAAGILLQGQTDFQCVFGNAVLDLHLNAGKLEMNCVEHGGILRADPGWLLAQWCAALDPLIGEGNRQLEAVPSAQQLFSIAWTIPSTLYSATAAWYRDATELQKVFPLDAPPTTPRQAPLSELLREVLGHGPLVSAADEARGQETSLSYWVGGDPPHDNDKLLLRLAAWQQSAPPGSHLWTLDGDRLVVVRTLAKGAATFIDTWNHREPSLGSRAVLKERLLRFHSVTQSPNASCVVDHGDIRF